MKLKTLIINVGYAESARNACLIIYHPIGFDSVQEAMKGFANDVVETDKKIESYEASECCELNTDQKFCPDCGNKIALKKEISKDKLRRLFFSIFDGNSDSNWWDLYGGEIGQWMIGSYNFNPGEGYTNVHTYGERVFVNAYKNLIDSEKFEYKIECGVSDPSIKIYKNES